MQNIITEDTERANLQKKNNGKKWTKFLKFCLLRDIGDKWVGKQVGQKLYIILYMHILYILQTHMTKDLHVEYINNSYNPLKGQTTQLFFK